jgi:hypothetical protein
MRKKVHEQYCNVLFLDKRGLPAICCTIELDYNNKECYRQSPSYLKGEKKNKKNRIIVTIT